MNAGLFGNKLTRGQQTARVNATGRALAAVIRPREQSTRALIRVMLQVMITDYDRPRHAVHPMIAFEQTISENLTLFCPFDYVV